MLKRPLTLILAGTALACTAMAGCSTAVEAPAKQAEVPTEALTLDLKAGQVLQFAFIKPREGEAAKLVRQEYFKTAIPYAESLGDEFLGSLRVEETMIGKNKPVGIAIYAFPDDAAKEKFQASPDWETYQKMRREGWAELHVLSATLPQNTVMTFDPKKEYTFAAAWTKPGTLETYQRYLDGIEPDFDEIGARFVAQLNGVDLQSHSDDADDPSQLTIVEWSNGVSLQGLQNTKGYQENSKYFQEAITRFDFYRTSVPTPSS